MHTYIRSRLRKAVAFLLISTVLLGIPSSAFADSGSDLDVLATPAIPESGPTGSTTPENQPLESFTASTTLAQTEATSTTASTTAGDATTTQSVHHTDIPNGSHIVSDTTWSKAGSPYVIENRLDIYNGTLTIDPGVVVKFGKDGMLLVDAGSLVIGNQHSEEPVIITSIADDSAGGNTNGTDPTSPDDARWRYIGAENGSAVIDIGHADFRYAGGEATYALCGKVPPTVYIKTCGEAKRFDGAIRSDAGRVSIYDSKFEWTGAADIVAIDGTLSFEHDRFDDAAELMNIWPNPNTPSLTIELHDSSIGHAPVLLTHKKAILDFQNNWWSSVDGPPGDWYSQGWDPYEEVSSIQNISPWLLSDPFYASDTPAAVCASDCASNVLFLPGIEDSRLYDADGKLWEPSLLNGNADVNALLLDSNGKSVRSDITTNEGDVIASVQNSDIYTSFKTKMEALKETGIMRDWKASAYDWRLSLEDIIGSGKKTGTEISYSNATDTPYLEQTVRALAASSKTGKVTIVAHSNGGLVAKALMEKMGAIDTAKLIDNVVLVGVPQSGAPGAIGSLLYGYQSGIPKNFPVVVSLDTIRSFLLNAPMLYHLLPAQSYFDTLRDTSHQVAAFSGAHEYQSEQHTYGSAINNEQELVDFLSAADGGRDTPPARDVSKAAIANPKLLSYARIEHILLDSWIAPPGVNIYQIGGWGADTISGIDFYEQKSLLGLFGYEKHYRPELVEDGDGSVPVPSALMMPTVTNVKSYWVDLHALRVDTKKTYTHGTLLAIPQLLDFIGDIARGTVPSAKYLSESAPATLQHSKKLLFVIHSSASFDLYDDSSGHTGPLSDGTIEETIPDSTYGVLGEAQYISAPVGPTYQLRVRTKTSGPLSLDVQEHGDDVVIATSTLADIPLTTNATATLTIKDMLESTSTLIVDNDADGVTDVTIPLTVGSTTLYEAPTVPEPVATSTIVATVYETGSTTIPILGTSKSAGSSNRSVSGSAPISVRSVMLPAKEGGRVPASSTQSIVGNTAVFAGTSASTTTEIGGVEQVTHDSQVPEEVLNAPVEQSEDFKRESETSLMLSAAALDAASLPNVILKLLRILKTFLHMLWRNIGH